MLNGDKDKYAIAPCEDKKFVVVSLSEDILVKQIKLANYERFSSSVKEFQVMGSQTMGKWFEMGTYMAKPLLKLPVLEDRFVEYDMRANEDGIMEPGTRIHFLWNESKISRSQRIEEESVSSLNFDEPIS